jgi:hypothetical protein
MGLGIATTGFEIVLQIRRTININPFGVACQTATCQQSHQAKDVIAMHMSDENPGKLTDFYVAAKQLMLRPFAAIKQPGFRSLRQA